jgi:hypothetical protein
MKNRAERGSLQLAVLEMRDVLRIDWGNPEEGGMAR